MYCSEDRRSLAKGHLPNIKATPEEIAQANASARQEVTIDD